MWLVREGSVWSYYHKITRLTNFVISSRTLSFVYDSLSPNLMINMARQLTIKEAAPPPKPTTLCECKIFTQIPTFQVLFHQRSHPSLKFSILPHLVSHVSSELPVPVHIGSFVFMLVINKLFVKTVCARHVRCVTGSSKLQDNPISYHMGIFWRRIDLTERTLEYIQSDCPTLIVLLNFSNLTKY